MVRCTTRVSKYLLPLSVIMTSNIAKWKINWSTLNQRVVGERLIGLYIIENMPVLGDFITYGTK